MVRDKERRVEQISAVLSDEVIAREPLSPYRLERFEREPEFPEELVL